MWCSSSDTYDSTTITVNTQSHHKIVRIPPGEAVVLNSAERAPYLLLVEILHDDLNFDPSKRGNKEILKRIVSKENERKGASKELITFGNKRSCPSVVVDAVVGSEQVLGKDTADTQDGGVTNDADTPPESNPTLRVLDDEEMDLVEQVYGEGQSLRGPIDLTETIVLPPTPNNRELELATWSRGSPLPSSPVVEQSTALVSVTSSRSTPHLSDSLRSPSTGASGGEFILSLDDYSERMRTAAIMLAQLNASLVRETVTPLSKPMGHGTDAAQGGVQDISSSSSGSLSWLPGSSWLGVATSDGTSNGPVHPSESPGGNFRPHDTTTSASITRMRVQHAEAAAIRDRIMQEMLALEEERMARMREGEIGFEESGSSGGMKTAEDEQIIKSELSKVDPSALVFSESWVAKKVREAWYVAFIVLILRSESNTAWIALWTPRCGTLFIFAWVLRELRCW
jgi:hypothetical protein